MIIPSEITSQALKYWIPTYLVLMLHGSAITSMPKFLEIFVIYPLWCGSIMAIYTFSRSMNLEDMEEQVGIDPTQNVIMGISLYIACPIAVIVSVMFYAQFANGYQGLEWVVIVFGGLTFDQVALKIREALRD